MVMYYDSLMDRDQLVSGDPGAGYHPAIAKTETRYAGRALYHRCSDGF